MDIEEPEIRPIPKYSFLTGPDYRMRHHVIYSHPYQLIFEVMISDPAITFPLLPASHYQKISEEPDLWMCLIYPSDIDFTEDELHAEFGQVIDWYMGDNPNATLE